MSPSRAALSTSRPLYDAADQPARLSLEIDGISHQSGVIPILSQDILRMPFCVLTRFARQDGATLPKMLVVCSLSGHFSILLRDLVIGLRPTFDVFITDWISARHVLVRHGSFDLEANNSYAAAMMEYLGPNLTIEGEIDDVAKHEHSAEDTTQKCEIDLLETD